ncbi:MAG: glycosyltransferase family 2 protein [Actinobacteria bacterium]|nr:MAG: glycosyltransferase family 2 protein [Actinomycetota bacterium]
MKLSIVIPVYNEQNTIKEVLEKIEAVKLQPDIEKEIIVVDDGSSDMTSEILKKFNDDKIYRIHNAVLNFGKGTATRIGIKYAKGDIILIQDADLEYDPNDYPALIAPIISNKAEIVYGSRFLGKTENMTKANLLANKILTFTANLLYRANISDEATCYKVFHKRALDDIELKCKRFEFCPEVTAKVRKKGYKIAEVPISYRARNTSEGKKIRWQDGFVAIWTLIKYRFVD